MKTASFVLFLFCSTLLSAQQLAPNPACANQAPYCRTVLTLDTSDNRYSINVMGFNDLLFGWTRIDPPLPGKSATPCPNSGLPADGNNAILCFYTADPTLPPPSAGMPANSVQNTWTFMGQFPAQDVWVCNETGDPHNCNSSAKGPGPTPYDTGLHTYCNSQQEKGDLMCYREQPMEIVWQCDNKYIYTSGHRILRATNLMTDWNFTVIAYPQIQEMPNNALGRPGSFAAQGPYNRLFYGNYNDAFTAQDFYWPDAYVWYSDDCGDSWTMSLSSPGRHIHSINTDPAETPANSHIYATADAEGLSEPNGTAGLWMSSDGGITFNRVSANSVGIDFVFPSASTKIFLESDGISSNSGPLLSWDKTVTLSSGPPQPTQTVPFPMQLGSKCPQWSGSGEGIWLTAEQNIFIASSTDGQPGRNGVWLLEPPYNTPVLLEDLAPPIISITSKDGKTATVTTCESHGLLSTDFVQIGGTRGTSTSTLTFDARVAKITVTSANTFTYQCQAPTSAPTCPSQPATVGFATKITGWEFARTVEVTDPNTNYTYLYNFNQRIAKPKFPGQ